MTGFYYHEGWGLVITGGIVSEATVTSMFYSIELFKSYPLLRPPTMIAGSFTKLGNSLVYYSHERMNWDQAKIKCDEMDSSLLEIWSEHEFMEVRYINSLFRTIYHSLVARKMSQYNKTI